MRLTPESLVHWTIVNNEDFSKATLSCPARAAFPLEAHYKSLGLPDAIVGNGTGVASHLVLADGPAVFALPVPVAGMASHPVFLANDGPVVAAVSAPVVGIASRGGKNSSGFWSC